MKKSNFMPSVVLGCICLVVAILLSGINMFTAPIIAERQAAAANEALLEVLPNGKNFKELELTADYPSIVKKGWTADGGSVFQMEVIGYASGLIIMCGVDAEGKIAGVKHIASSETFGAEGELNDAYTAKKDTIDSLEMILSASASKGAPMTSQAYFDAIKAALQSALIAGGAEVDTRTPEQILQDNCNAALGTTDLVFTKWFATAALTDIDAVYETAEGRVYVIGEVFIGIKADGTVVSTDADAELKSKAQNADSVIAGITLTDVDKPADAKANIVSIKKASNGAYVFTLTADGYQAMFDWGDGTKIELMVSIDAEGKIIDVITVSHAESKGFGDACATEEYYEQFRGQNGADVIVSSKYPSDHHDDLIAPDSTDIGAIASATYTTVGYQTAVKAAYEAFELLTATEGGNE